MVKYCGFLLVLCAGLVLACKSDKGDSVRPAYSQGGVSALPEGSVIQSLTLESGSLPGGIDSYTFTPSELLLKGTWMRLQGDQTFRAEAEIQVSELEWALVEQNVQNLKLTEIDPAKCKDAEGEEKVLSVTYVVGGEAETLEIPTVSASAYTCGDYAMPDETFDLIIKAVKDKLPPPTDMSQYEII